MTRPRVVRTTTPNGVTGRVGVLGGEYSLRSTKGRDDNKRSARRFRKLKFESNAPVGLERHGVYTGREEVH